MKFLRPVQLPAGVEGRLYLCSMPGRYQPLDACWRELRKAGCSTLLSLAPPKEIAQKSPEYARAIDAGTLPCAHSGFR